MKKTVFKILSVFMAVLIGIITFTCTAFADTAEEKPLGVSDWFCENGDDCIYLHLNVDPSFTKVLDDGTSGETTVKLVSRKYFANETIKGKAIVGAGEGSLILVFPADQIEYYTIYSLYIDGGVVTNEDMTVVNSAYTNDNYYGDLLLDDATNNRAVYNVYAFIHSVFSLFNLIFKFI